MRRGGPPGVSTQFISLPAQSIPVLPLFYERSISTYYLGPNDSSINRGGREDTGDNEARPDEMGSGPAQPTADPTSFGGTSFHQTPIQRPFRPSAGSL